MIGLIYIIIAQFLWATEFIIIRKFFSNHNAFFVMAVASVVSAIFYLPSLFLIKQKVTSQEIVIMVIYGFTSWYLAQMVYAKGIQISHNTFAAATVTLSLPLFTLVLSYFFLKEIVSIRIIFGAVLMMAGFILLSAK